ncbi:MAG: GMC family oxidoreductase, partial [Chlorobia bacterium]|nr:GMC family oxidoreductase [Fimbriimonadaceae bacterium]
MSDFDAVVVGGGAGGGVAAYVLAKAGKKVLLIERGKWLSYADERRDHLRNHRISLYGHNTGPDLEGNPRVFIDPLGHRHVLKPHQGGYNANAACMGSGTYVYGGQAWRFHPNDFKMASTYWVPEGSSLADWPIRYQDLEPYYELAEWEIGVAGGKPAPQMPGRRDYPMPPHRMTRKGSILRDAAGKLGWDTQDIPLLINSVDRGGRSACASCQHCVGFACPVDARNGTQNTVIQRAIETGNCEVWAESTVHRVTCRDGGWITGVMVDRGGEGLRQVDAEVVIVAAGAIETARLLFNSRTR